MLLNISGMEISFLKLNVHIEKLDVSEEWVDIEEFNRSLIGWRMDGCGTNYSLWLQGFEL